MIIDIIQAKLNESFNPVHLDVVNESDGHNVAPGSETHFKVVITAAQFEGLNAVKRHQSVYGVLSEELAGGVHALALHTYTPDEWLEIAKTPKSPPCLGGGYENS